MTLYGRTAGQARQHCLEPGLQCLDERAGLLLPSGAVLVGTGAANVGFDPVQFGDPPQSLGGGRRRRARGGISSTVLATTDQRRRMFCLVGPTE